MIRRPASKYRALIKFINLILIFIIHCNWFWLMVWWCLFIFLIFIFEQPGTTTKRNDHSTSSSQTQESFNRQQHHHQHKPVEKLRTHQIAEGDNLMEKTLRTRQKFENGERFPSFRPRFLLYTVLWHSDALPVLGLCFLLFLVIETICANKRYEEYAKKSDFHNETLFDRLTCDKNANSLWMDGVCAFVYFFWLFLHSFASQVCCSVAVAIDDAIFIFLFFLSTYHRHHHHHQPASLTETSAVELADGKSVSHSVSYS